MTIATAAAPSTAATLDSRAFADALARAAGCVPAAMDLGRSLGAGIDRVWFVACGSPNRAMRGLQYWIEHFSPSLEVRRYFPAELMAQDPRRLDARTLVVLGSKSGTTKETVAAAEFLRGKPCRTVGISLHADKPLARSVQHALAIGDTPESFLAMGMVANALIGGLLDAKDGWPLTDALRTSLAAMPDVIAETVALNDRRAAGQAQALRADRAIYHVASGPCFTTAYVFGVCVLMEMLWLHSYPIEAAEFFHGPFEIVDDKTPLILVLGEDPSRPLMERVARFCAKHAQRVMIYDSRDYPMTGVATEIRPILAPYVLQAALKRIAAHLSVLHGQPLTTRRYMWKGDY